jgi:hypothetical protein
MSLASRIECGHIYRVGVWNGVANLGRILRIDEKLLSGKSTSEIEEIIKNNAYGSYKKNELTSYVFYDLSGNNTKFSLEELGLAKAKANTAKVSTKMDTQSV